MRKLKPGPGLAADVVSADQRCRLTAAAIALVAEGGYASLTVRALSREAGVSTRTFYRQFSNVADCVRYASESTMLDALAEMKGPTSATRGGNDRPDVAVASLMRYFASNGDATNVALVGAFDAGPPVLARLKFVTGTFEQLFAELWTVSTTRHELVSGIVAGVLRVVRATTLAGRTDELPALAPALTDWVSSIASLPVAGTDRRNSTGKTLGRSNAPLASQSWKSEAAPKLADDRERILRAALKLSTAHGTANLTITQIRRAAGVSRRNFDRYFTNESECVLAAVEWLVGRAVAQARAWACRNPDPTSRTYRLILALSAQAASNQAVARLLFGGLLELGRDGLLCRERILAAGAARMQGDFSPSGPGDATAIEASAAAAWQMAEIDVMEGLAAGLPGKAALLDQVLLAPAANLSQARELLRSHPR